MNSTSNSYINFKQTHLAVTLSAIVLSSFANQTLAEETKTEKAKSAAQTMMEVISVRGTKTTVAQSAQQVPAQVVALGAEQLEARQVVNIEDLAFSTPNVALDGVGTVPGVANFSIRGLGINSSIPSIDPHVGVFIDGVYTGVTYGVITDTFDLESIETFKGPQGLLFGRNVTGGAVLLRSARPTGEFGAKVKVGFEENQITLAGAVEGALSDKVAAKISVYNKDDDGSFYNSTLGREVGEEKTQTVRGTVVFTPTDTSKLTLIAEHGSIEGDGAITQDKTDGDAKKGGSDTFVSAADEPGIADISWDQLTFEASFDLGPGRLTNIMGYRTVESYSLSDVDATFFRGYHVDILLDQKQFSNELRYNVSPTDNWDLTTGVFYFTQEFDNWNRRIHFIPALDRDIFRIGGGVQEQTTLGVFMNNDYHVNDNLVINAGLRFTDEEKDVSVYPVATLGADGTSEFCISTPISCSGNPTINDSDSNVTPKLGFTWTNDDAAEWLVYGHWARAYRSGMFNFRTEIEPHATDVEEHSSIELGIKTTSEDGNLRVNAAIFRNDITDMVRETNVPDEANNSIRQDIVNTADATIQGAEIDAMLLVNENLVLTAAVGILDGKYNEVLNDLNGDGAIDGVDLGLRIPRLSDLTYNLGVTYDLPIGDFGLLSTRANYNFRSEAAYNDSNSSIFDDLRMVNAGMTFKPNKGNWKVSLYGKNLTDTVVLGGITNLPPSLAGGYFAPLKKGRRYGIEFTYSM